MQENIFFSKTSKHKFIQNLGNWDFRTKIKLYVQREIPKRENL